MNNTEKKMGVFKIVNVKQKIGIQFILVILLIFSLNCISVFGAEASGSDNEMITKNPVKLENEMMALDAKEINYSNDNGIIEASGGVTVTFKNDDLRLETEQLTYNSIDGIVKASGIVKMITSQAVFLINTITCDIKNKTGSGGSLTGTIFGNAVDVRDYSITGKSIEYKNGIKVISRATVTRCPKVKPDYLFKAKKVTIKEKRVYLSNIVLYIKGIPIFYFPEFSFLIGKKDWDLPPIQINFDKVYGTIINENSIAPINSKWDFRTNIAVETEGTSNVGVGIGYHFNNKLLDCFSVNNDLAGNWKLADAVFYNTRNFLFSVDGLAALSGTDEGQFGFSITRKYWRGWGGDWQFGILARREAKRVDQNSAFYGGIYGGFQLDYKPFKNLTLSVLQLNNYVIYTQPNMFSNNAGQDDYNDFYVSIGTNFLYNYNIPLNQSFKFNLSGQYNFTQKYYYTGQQWVTQNYSIVYDSCCYAIKLGWDNVFQGWQFGPDF